MNEKVQILMSTYNGQTYIREQMESLLNQDYPNMEILIRDDGSTDRTVNILREYEAAHANIHVFAEKNVGVTASFFELLKKSNAAYIAFCDQDDVWLSCKVTRAVKKLEVVQGPALYCSNKILVDSKLQVIAVNGGKKLRPGFENAVVECICTGCTSMVNKELADNIRNHIPKHAIIHDWWCYLAASYLGTVVFDEQAYIWYRQHGGNVIGASPTVFGIIHAKAEYVKKNKGKLRGQLQDFVKLYQEYPKKDKLVQLLLASEMIPAKCKVVFGHSFYRQEKLDGFITRILFLINKML
jgi:glycosyltransferase involved in cell wall biosynthesis